MTLLVEILTIISFIGGCFLWLKNELREDLQKLYQDLRVQENRQTKIYKALSKVITKINHHNDIILTNSNCLNEIDLHLAKTSTGYRQIKSEKPIINDEYIENLSEIFKANDTY